MLYEPNVSTELSNHFILSYILHIIFCHSGALVEGEKLLLSGGWVYFRDVQFYDPECSKQIKPPLGEGRICLTNLRMLLLCAETSSGKFMALQKNPGNTRVFFIFQF